MEFYNLETGDFSGIQDNVKNKKESNLIPKNDDKGKDMCYDHDISFLYEKQDKEFAKSLRHSLSIEQTEMILDEIVIAHIKGNEKLQISDDTCSETIDTLQKMGFAVRYEGLDLVVRWKSEDALSCIKSRYSLRGLSNTDLKRECGYIIERLEVAFEEEKYAVYKHIIKKETYVYISGQLSRRIVAAQIEQYLRTYGIRCDIVACVNSPNMAITWHFKKWVILNIS